MREMPLSDGISAILCGMLVRIQSCSYFTLARIHSILTKNRHNAYLERELISTVFLYDLLNNYNVLYITVG